MRLSLARHRGVGDAAAGAAGGASAAGAGAAAAGAAGAAGAGAGSARIDAGLDPALLEFELSSTRRRAPH